GLPWEEACLDEWLPCRLLLLGEGGGGEGGAARRDGGVISRSGPRCASDVLDDAVACVVPRGSRRAQPAVIPDALSPITTTAPEPRLQQPAMAKPIASAKISTRSAVMSPLDVPK